jgi:hypothetical protein
MRFFASGSLILLLGTLAWAADGAQPSFKLYKSFSDLQADSGKECYLIATDCVVCAISPDRTLVCSSAGIACVPKEWRCYESPEKQPP